MWKTGAGAVVGSYPIRLRSEPWEYEDGADGGGLSVVDGEKSRVEGFGWFVVLVL